MCLLTDKSKLTMVVVCVVEEMPAYIFFGNSYFVHL